MLSIKDKIEVLPRLGKTLANKFHKLNIWTIEDLLYHFPLRYEDYSEVFLISNLKVKEKFTVKVRIDLIRNRRSRRKSMILTEAMVSDETGSLQVIWFNQAYISQSLKVGDWVYLSGEIRDPYSFQLVNPIYEKVSNNSLRQNKIFPVYRLTSSLSSRQISSFIKTALNNIKIKDFLAVELIHKYKLLNIEDAFREIHFPSNQVKLKEAEKRFKFEELFILQLHAFSIRNKLKQLKTVNITFKEESTKKFVKSLPYTLTDEQRKVAWEILLDMQRDKRPMNRLLEGDVGSGKTVVASLAMLNVLENNYNSVLLAPTEILAEQHFYSLQKILVNIADLNIVLFTRSNRYLFKSNGQKIEKLTKKKILEYLTNDERKIIIGTHSLIQDAVSLNNTALLIVDEQHRFGVKQREAIKEKSFLGDDTYPHFLSMTATPIPRSLALTIYGDLDISIIEKLPKGRKQIITEIIEEKDKLKAYDLIRSEIQEEHQIFAVCPLIDESDKLNLKSVNQLYEELKTVFPEYNIAILHGKMKSKEKAEIMEEFLANKINILVSTSVIEVGIDIPNATVIMIESAERFGLAQLHQLRGRVGRSDKQSYCLLIPSNKISERLELFAKSTNGFELAEYDLQLRGPGDVFGYEQSGLLSLKIAKLSDSLLIQLARQASKDILELDPNLIKHPALANKLKEFANLIALE